MKLALTFILACVGFSSRSGRSSAHGWKTTEECNKDALKLAKIFRHDQIEKLYLGAIEKEEKAYCIEMNEPSDCITTTFQDWFLGLKLWLVSPTLINGLCKDAKLTNVTENEVCEQCHRDMQQVGTFLKKPATWEDAMRLLRGDKFCRLNDDFKSTEECIRKIHMIVPLAVQVLADLTSNHKPVVCNWVKGCPPNKKKIHPGTHTEEL